MCISEQVFHVALVVELDALGIVAARKRVENIVGIVQDRKAVVGPDPDLVVEIHRERGDVIGRQRAGIISAVEQLELIVRSICDRSVVLVAVQPGVEDIHPLVSVVVDRHPSRKLRFGCRPHVERVPGAIGSLYFQRLVRQAVEDPQVPSFIIFHVGNTACVVVQGSQFQDRVTGIIDLRDLVAVGYDGQRLPAIGADSDLVGIVRVDRYGIDIPQRLVLPFRLVVDVEQLPLLVIEHIGSRIVVREAALLQGPPGNGDLALGAAQREKAVLWRTADVDGPVIDVIVVIHQSVHLVADVMLSVVISHAIRAESIGKAVRIDRVHEREIRVVVQHASLEDHIKHVVGDLQAGDLHVEHVSDHHFQRVAAGEPVHGILPVSVFGISHEQAVVEQHETFVACVRSRIWKSRVCGPLRRICQRHMVEVAFEDLFGGKRIDRIAFDGRFEDRIGRAVRVIRIRYLVLGRVDLHDAEAGGNVDEAIVGDKLADLFVALYGSQLQRRNVGDRIIFDLVDVPVGIAHPESIGSRVEVQGRQVDVGQGVDIRPHGAFARFHVIFDQPGRERSHHDAVACRHVHRLRRRYMQAPLPRTDLGKSVWQQEKQRGKSDELHSKYFHFHSG